VTQPSLSQAIQRLEAELGARLLDRSTRSVALTDAGRLLHEEGRRLLIDAGRLARDVQDIGRGGQREARLGFMLPGPGARAPDLLERFAAARPRDAVRLIPLDLPDRLRAVLDGEVDAALVLGPVRGAPRCWRSRRSPWSPAWCACAPITRSPAPRPADAARPRRGGAAAQLDAGRLVRRPGLLGRAPVAGRIGTCASGRRSSAPRRRCSSSCWGAAW
jgi:DNA-binding transcriptional LysR family regulator